MTYDLDTVRRALHDHIAKEILLRKAPPALDEDLFAGGSGFDSMSLTRVLVFIEQRFGVRIPDEEVDLDAVSTVDSMARFRRRPHRGRAGLAGARGRHVPPARRGPGARAATPSRSRRAAAPR